MPIYAGVGVSNNKDYKRAIAEAIYQTKNSLKENQISLAVVITSPDFAFPNLLKAISNIVGLSVPLIGVTNNAIFTQEGIFSHAIAIALISAKEAHFNTASSKSVLKDPQAGGDELAKQLLFGMKNILRRFVLFFSDGSITDNQPLLSGIQQRLGQSFPIIAATPASNNIETNKTFQYFNQEVLNGSAVGLLWAGKVNFGFGIKHGWKPIGKPHRVTSAYKSTITQIEGKPAAALYQDYFAKDIPELKKELRRISCLYPLGINVSGEEEYLLRNILSIENDGSLICRDDVPNGSRVRLMIGTKESCLLATEEAARDAKQNLQLQTYPKGKDASIIFVLNSASRLYLLGRQITKEIEIIKSQFPHTPIIGLCTYREQAPLKTTDFAGKTYSHNQTIVILAMS
ncbi:MAG: FIST C-terminal domain-containing protein [Candidatus Omnitrophica bacterium]|nr:FIST C-terminal domain-containing protein [Candidatus Omnitrophota bacterium]